MAKITLELSDEEQTGLLSFVDAALRSNGRAALVGAIHWEQKIAQAQEAAKALPQSPASTASASPIVGGPATSVG